jgi:hypothetical protein
MLSAGPLGQDPPEAYIIRGLISPGLVVIFVHVSDQPSFRSLIRYLLQTLDAKGGWDVRSWEGLLDSFNLRGYKTSGGIASYGLKESTSETPNKRLAMFFFLSEE